MKRACDAELAVTHLIRISISEFLTAHAVISGLCGGVLVNPIQFYEAFRIRGIAYH
ncbi:MAG: hypothetical protein WED81_03820 [Rhodothermales bacterium]